MDCEFTIVQQWNGGNHTELKLYNPAPETIAACQSQNKGQVSQIVDPTTNRMTYVTASYPSITIQAGYETDPLLTTVCIGNIWKWRVNKDGVDKILELTIDGAQAYKQQVVKGLSLKGNVKVSQIISQVLSLAGASVGAAYIKLGNDRTYNGKNINCETLYNVMIELAQFSDSFVFMDNGCIYIYPASQQNANAKTLSPGNAFILDYTNGLLDVPEIKDFERYDAKGNTIPVLGYSIRTIFLPNLNLHDVVQFPVKDYTGTMTNTILGIVRNAKKEFATKDDAYSEYDIEAAA
jgi:hypothetical protein